MKKIVILLIAFIMYNCKAQQQPVQQIIPLENMINYVDADMDLPDNSYFKDVNNLLDNYTGTWGGTYNNKNFLIMVEEDTHTFLGIAEDRLVLRYKITDSNGNILVNTLGLPEEDTYVVHGRYFSGGGSKYLLTYIGYEAECNQKGTLYLESVNNGTQLHLSFFQDHDIILSSECPNGTAEQVFPTDTYITLTPE